MKNFLVNTIVFTEGKKARLVSELMGAGAVGAIVSSVCITAACVIKCMSERGYEATYVEEQCRKIVDQLIAYERPWNKFRRWLHERIHDILNEVRRIFNWAN